jgi:hypothetical protein
MEVWHWLKTACEEGFRRNSRFLVLGWLGGIAICLIAVWAGDGIYYYLDFRWSGKPLSGLMSLASGFCLVACGWGLLVGARRAMRRPDGRAEATAWIIAGLGSIWLAFDEVAQIHEMLAMAMEEAKVPRPFGVLDHDLYIFGAYAVAFLVLLRMLWPARRSLEPVMLPLSVAIVCFTISEMMDQIPWDELTRDAQKWVGSIEEVSKTLGCWTLAMCGLICADATEGGPRGRDAPPPGGPRPPAATPARD